jgi:hypothetical protein
MRRLRRATFRLPAKQIFAEVFVGYNNSNEIFATRAQAGVFI